MDALARVRVPLVFPRRLTRRATPRHRPARGARVGRSCSRGVRHVLREDTDEKTMRRATLARLPHSGRRDAGSGGSPSAEPSGT